MLNRTSVRIAAVVVVIVSVLALYQNCGDFSALQGSSSQSRSSTSRLMVLGMDSGGGLIPPAMQATLADAENQAVNTAQDPAKSVDALAPDRGVCVIRGGAGKFLAPADFRSRADCQALCAQMSANVNRACVWRDQPIYGDPTAECSIKGGAFAVLSTLPNVTRSACTSECTRFTSNPNRFCDWGEERLLDPPRGSECRVYGGSGVSLLPHQILFADRTECAQLCANFSDRVYRTCRHGNETFQQPPESSKCEIWGGAGKVLIPVFYGTRGDCSSRCDSFTQNVNRVCWYGNERLR